VGKTEKFGTFENKEKNGKNGQIFNFIKSDIVHTFLLKNYYFFFSIKILFIIFKENKR
jgi:hypothetical protein